MTHVADSATWFHVRLERGFLRQAHEFNLQEHDVIERYVRPWRDGQPVEIADKTFSPPAAKMIIYAGRRVPPNQTAMGQGWSNAVKLGEDVTASLLAASPEPDSASVPARAEPPPGGALDPLAASVFVSHAAADKVIVEPFVSTILQLGCLLAPEQIFSSSGQDTRVPSGRELIDDVRERVGQSTLVVAIVTPTYQTRPVCAAELGAAWAKTDNLFPIAVPSAARTDMEGVLEAMAVRYLNDSAALNELHDRINKITGNPVPPATWGRYRERWLREVDALAAQVPRPEEVSAEELRRAQRDLQGAREALAEAEAENAELRSSVEKYRAAGTI
jgi:hypothetical protein